MRAPTPAQRRIRPLRLVADRDRRCDRVLLCLGGVGVGVDLYDEATAIDRDDPDDRRVDNYLRAYLSIGTTSAPNSLECDQDSGLEPIRAFRADCWTARAALRRRHRRDLGTADCRRLRVISGSSRRSSPGPSSNAESSVQTWQFTVVDEGGWRVCARAADRLTTRPRADAPAPRASWAPDRSTPSGTSPARWRRRTQMSPSALVCTSVTARRSRRSAAVDHLHHPPAGDGVDVDGRHRDPRAPARRARPAGRSRRGDRPAAVAASPSVSTQTRSTGTSGANTSICSASARYHSCSGITGT